MHRVYKFLLLAIALSMLVFLAGCSKAETDDLASPHKIEIVATLFPQYDFAKQVGGDNVNVTLLLPPGAESHTYEPTPLDIAKINDADIFLYTGKEMEQWADKIAKSTGRNVKIVDLSKGIIAHTSDVADSHIWLDLSNAQKMTSTICDALIEIDPNNTEYYTEKANDYIEKLSLLDNEIMDLVKQKGGKPIVFGSHFAYYYFVNRYNILYMSVYDSCGAEAEPSIQRVMNVVDFVEQNDINIIYHEEFADPKIARSICDETGARLMLFSTLHNVTKDELNESVSFIDLMRQNMINLEAGFQ